MKATAKKTALKKIVGGYCKDGMGGGTTKKITLSDGDMESIAPYKNAFYKRMKAIGAFQRIAKTSGLMG